jgi:hypothetical protein
MSVPVTLLFRQYVYIGGRWVLVGDLRECLWGLWLYVLGFVGLLPSDLLRLWRKPHRRNCDNGLISIKTVGWPV